MSPSLKAKSEAIAIREEKDKASTNTNFFMLLDRGKNPVHQLGSGVGRDNPVAVVFEGQVLLERVLDTGVGALRSGDAGELVPGIGDARFHIERKHIEDGRAIGAGHGEEGSGAPVGGHLDLGQVGSGFSGGGAEANGDARNGEHGNEGSNKLFHNCIS